MINGRLIPTNYCEESRICFEIKRKKIENNNKNIKNALVENC